MEITFKAAQQLVPEGVKLVRLRFNYAIKTKDKVRYFPNVESVYYYLKGARISGFKLT